MAKKTKKATEDTVEFVVIKPVKHNGEDYQVGEIIELTEKDGVPLLELGVINVDDEDWDEGELSSETKAGIDESNPEVKIEIDAETGGEVKAEIETVAPPEIEAV